MLEMRKDADRRHRHWVNVLAQVTRELTEAEMNLAGQVSMNVLGQVSVLGPVGASRRPTQVHDNSHCCESSNQAMPLDYFTRGSLLHSLTTYDTNEAFGALMSVEGKRESCAGI